jgi:Sec-independent protein translocase protein TatA
MFNISFGEILLILIVSIVVIKPKDLSEVPYKIGQLMSKIQMYWKKIKLELNKATKDD